MRAAVVALVVLGVLAVAPTAEARTGSNCVSGAEWQSLLDSAFGDVNHSARREVIEAAWDVRPVGAPNRYYLPANSDRWYSEAYSFCGSSMVKIVVVYRNSSDGWQYALKGEFI